MPLLPQLRLEPLRRLRALVARRSRSWYGPHPQPRRLRVRALYSFQFAFLLFLPYLHILTDGHNRLMLGFSLRGLLQIYAVMTGTALTFLAGHVALGFVVGALPSKWRGFAHRVCLGPLFAFGACAAAYLLLIHLPWSDPDAALAGYHSHFKWIWASVALGVISWPMLWRAFVGVGERLLQLLIPLPLILLLHLQGYPAISGPPTPPPFEADSSNGTTPANGDGGANPGSNLGSNLGAGLATGPTYIFIFDEWDRLETFGKGPVAERFPHLAELLATSTSFAAATSTSNMTLHSIPAILFQTQSEVKIDDRGSTWFAAEGDWQPSTAHESLFARLAPAGAPRWLIGRDVPYSILLGDQVDWVDQMPYDTGQYLGLGEMVRAHLFKASFYGRFPFHRLLGLQHYPADFALQSLTRQHGLTLRCIEHGGPRLVAVFHYLLPHNPFHYTRHGVRPDYRTAHVDPAAGYEGNLQYLDTVIGQLVAEIRRAGHWDSCTLVLTSDHGTDAPGTHDRRLEVPLIVKLPQQREARVVHEPIRTTEFVAWIERNVGKTAGD
ncbi:MAG: sulfatase-like hydrolase/transferase [Planctomycetota bacterium]